MGDDVHDGAAGLIFEGPPVHLFLSILTAFQREMSRFPYVLENDQPFVVTIPGAQSMVATV